jgi:putative sterol carrier protein
MSDRELTLESLSSGESLDSKELLKLVEGLDAADQAIAEVSLDSIAQRIDPRDLGKADFARLLAALDRLKDAAAAVTVSQIEPHTFAVLISRVSKAQLAAVFARPELRELILDEIFRRMGSHLREDKAAHVKAVVHWRFADGSGDGGFDRYETVIADGGCTWSKERTSSPRTTITLQPSDFLQLIVGKTSPPVLFMTGKLRVKGDLAFAAGMMALFDLPRP